MERADIDAVVAHADRGRDLVDAAVVELVSTAPDAIAGFLREHALNGDTWRHVRDAAPTARPPSGATSWTTPSGSATSRACIDVLTLRGDRIATVTAFVTPEIFPRFGLPESLPLRGDESPCQPSRPTGQQDPRAAGRVLDPRVVHDGAHDLEPAAALGSGLGVAPAAVILIVISSAPARCSSTRRIVPGRRDRRARWRCCRLR